MSNSEFKIPLKALLEFYNSDADSPYLCDVIVEYIRNVLGENRVIDFRDEVSWQFYNQWMSLFNPECERISRNEFMNSFQAMEDWNNYSVRFGGGGDRENMRNYRTDCINEVINSTPNIELTFSFSFDVYT